MAQGRRSGFDPSESSVWGPGQSSNCYEEWSLITVHRASQPWSSIFESCPLGHLSRSAWAAMTKYQSLGDINKRIFSLPVLERSSLRSGFLGGQVLVGTLFLVCRWLPRTVSSRGRERAGATSSQVTESHREGPNLMTSSNPEAPSLKTIRVGVRALTYELGEDTVQPIALRPWPSKFTSFSHARRIPVIPISPGVLTHYRVRTNP